MHRSSSLLHISSRLCCDLLMAQEIRGYLRTRPDAFDMVLKSTDPRVLAAALHNPPALSGLSNAKLKMVQ